VDDRAVLVTAPLEKVRADRVQAVMILEARVFGEGVEALEAPAAGP
jgi:hypothetical protein